MEFPLSSIASLIGGKIVGDEKKIIKGIAPFGSVEDDQITFAGSLKYLEKLDDSPAGAVIIPSEAYENAKFTTNKNLIVVTDPQSSFEQVVSVFFPLKQAVKLIDPSAIIGQNTTFGSDLTIGACTVVGNNVSIGDRVEIMSGVVIADDVKIGSDTLIYPNVTILRGSTIGDRVIIHAGSVIGSDGFGFTNRDGKHHKIRHVGIVRIDDDVEIGACNTIDRGTFGKTWIKSGVKTDNQVHIAHNVTIGENTLLVAQVGIAGSTWIGKNVIIAGQAGVAGHLKIEDGSIVGPSAGIAKNIAKGNVISGSPGMPHRLWLKVHSILPRLPEMKKKIAELERRLKNIEK